MKRNSIRTGGSSRTSKASFERGIHGKSMKRKQPPPRMDPVIVENQQAHQWSVSQVTEKVLENTHLNNIIRKE